MQGLNNIQLSCEIAHCSSIASKLRTKFLEQHSDCQLLNKYSASTHFVLTTTHYNSAHSKWMRV